MADGVVYTKARRKRPGHRLRATKPPRFDTELHALMLDRDKERKDLGIGGTGRLFDRMEGLRGSRNSLSNQRARG